VTAVAGAHVCLRRVEPKNIFQLIADEQVTHMAGAPIVLNMIANAPLAERRPFAQQVEVAVGGAPPPSAIIAAMENLGFRVTHLYGLTECYGPSLIAEWQDDWPQLSVAARAEKMSRQGVRTLAVADVAIADPQTGQHLPADGQAMGEVLLRGNTLMKGYLANPEETRKAFADGWFHTGDLGVMHEDGYVELRDRSKDVIISGGENISSIEVENVLYRHPQVLEAAVVAKADEKWGETPHAFVELKADSGDVSAESIIEFCRDHLARFKVPRGVEFGPLPKTATGKIQKFVLRERVNSSR
jgi:fatty-acyl-CoA synthase